MNLGHIPPQHFRERRSGLMLLGHLQEAEDEHDRARREAYAGVTQALLDADKTLWSGLGEAVAVLARRVCEACAVSAFGETRPKIDQVARQLSEAIDDQLDGQGWRVMDAAARLAAGG
jgi:hypothetical protein